jgi:molybdate transport repressor ModE-like protein
MPDRIPTSRHGYKEVRLQQLRSFCETARLGSLTAAATSLGLAQPTVWEQVHALERDFETRLIERKPHGCKLTESGRLLAELAAPLVAGIDSLKRQVQQAEGQAASRLTVASTQRILIEDLPTTILEFERQHPHVHLRMMERTVEQIPAIVEAGEADLGVTTERPANPPSPWLVFEPCYKLDLYLVMPKDHPLASRPRITPADMAKYPLVNAPTGIPDAAVTAMLEKLGAFDTEPRRVEAFYTAVIRHYVEMGFGIGLVVGLPGHRASSNLHERSMSRHFGRITVNLVWRQGSLHHEPAVSFAEALRHQLNGSADIAPRRPRGKDPGKSSRGGNQRRQRRKA